MAMNLVVQMGRLTTQPELKITPNGIPVLSFTIAVPRYTKSGEHPESDFFDCVAWRSTAEFIAKWFSKGERILIQGTLGTKLWEDKEGKKRKSVEIVVDKAEFVERKTSNDTADKTTSVEDATSYFEEVDTVNGEDLPFN